MSSSAPCSKTNTRTPSSTGKEAEDLSTGTEIRKDLAVYLGGAGRGSRRFFRRVIQEPEVRELLNEMEGVKERQYEQRSSTNGKRTIGCDTCRAPNSPNKRQ